MLSATGIIAAALFSATGAGGASMSWEEWAQPATPKQKSGTQAKPRLILETGSAQPSKTLNLGIHFEIDKGWHLYWPGQNDSGLPIQVDLKLPDGWKAGEIQWPVPQRHVLEGDILDHVYYDRVTLIIPIQVAASEQAGAKHSITAELAWLVCADGCEKGDAVVKIDVPVTAPGAPSEPGKEARLFDQARKTMPQPLPTDGSVTATLKDGRLKIAVKDGRGVAFYPHESSTPVENVIDDCSGRDGNLDIAVKPPSADQPAVVGILEVSPTGKDKQPRYYTIHLPPPAPAKPALQPSSPPTGKP